MQPVGQSDERQKQMLTVAVQGVTCHDHQRSFLVKTLHDIVCTEALTDESSSDVNTRISDNELRSYLVAKLVRHHRINESPLYQKQNCHWLGGKVGTYPLDTHQA